MSNVLAQLEARRHRTTVLDTGLKVGWHYPDVEECILRVGQVPLPALATAGPVPTEAEALALVASEPEVFAKGLEYVRAIVAAMLDDVDGLVIEAGDDRAAIVEALEPQERQQLFLIGTRQQDPEAPRGEA